VGQGQRVRLWLCLNESWFVDSFSEMLSLCDLISGINYEVSITHSSRLLTSCSLVGRQVERDTIRRVGV
jgi:hypothetical protein